jgi:predicted RNase H-like HicB family nuclease
MNEYVVIYEQGDDGGWGAYLPDLPGVVALGSTRTEVAERVKEALSAALFRGAASARREPASAPSPAGTVAA